MSSGDVTGASDPLHDLTICTVSFHHAPHLKLNHELVRRMNPNMHIRWIVGENSPVESPCRLADGALDDVTVLATEALQADGPRSSHRHTTALRACISAVKTRFFVVLDPDFYIGRPGWA